MSLIVLPRTSMARVAELADALASGASSRKGVEVRVLSRAPHILNNLRRVSIVLATSAIHYSRFISYSSKDNEFAQQVYAAFQARGIRCWFAPRDLPIGAKTWDTFDKTIEMQDQLVVAQ
jgi:hypothetical protein